MKKQVVYIFVFAFMIIGILFVSSVNLDLNHDGTINIQDLQILASHYEGKATYNSTFDINNDSKVDLFDVVKVAKDIGTNTNSNSPNNSGGNSSGILFHSDWSTATGNSTTALSDGGRWDLIWNSNNVLSVVPATGLGFPAGMTNVLRVAHTYPTVYGGSVNKGVDISQNPTTPHGWSIPPIGGSLYFRDYVRYDFDSNVILSQNTGHFDMSSTDVSGNWEWDVGKNSGTTDFVMSFTAPFGNTTDKWRFLTSLDGSITGSRTNQAELPAGTYRREWRFTRVGVDDWNLDIRIYGPDDKTLLWNASDISENTADVLLTIGGQNLAMNDTFLQGFHYGTNGGTFSGYNRTQYSYRGGICVRNDTWCGPYSNGV